MSDDASYSLRESEPEERENAHTGEALERAREQRRLAREILREQEEERSTSGSAPDVVSSSDMAKGQSTEEAGDE